MIFVKVIIISNTLAKNVILCKKCWGTLCLRTTAALTNAELFKISIKLEYQDMDYLQRKSISVLWETKSNYQSLFSEMNPCFYNPCKNGGRCNYMGNGDYQCACPEDYTGRNCEGRCDETEFQFSIKKMNSKLWEKLESRGNN